MEWLAAAAGVLQIAGGLFGSGRQKRLEKQMVKLEYESNKEDIRRREFEIEQVKGAAKALTETGGVRHTGGSSAQGVLDTMTDQFRKELDWMREYSFRAKQLGMKRASLNYQTNVMSSITGGLMSFSAMKS